MLCIAIKNLNSRIRTTHQCMPMSPHFKFDVSRYILPSSTDTQNNAWLQQKIDRECLLRPHQSCFLSQNHTYVFGGKVGDYTGTDNFDVDLSIRHSAITEYIFVRNHVKWETGYHQPMVTIKLFYFFHLCVVSANCCLYIIAYSGFFILNAVSNCTLNAFLVYFPHVPFSFSFFL